MLLTREKASSRSPERKKGAGSRQEGSRSGPGQSEGESLTGELRGNPICLMGRKSRRVDSRRRTLDR